MWGQAGLVWARHDMNRDVCAAPEGDYGLHAVANEAVGGRAASATAIEAQSTFGNTVSTVAASRSRATSMGMLSKKRPGWRGRSDRRLLNFWWASPCSPMVKAACAQAMLERVPDQPA